VSAAIARVLITTDSVGGVWQYSLDLAQALARHGWNPVVAHLGPAPTPEQREHAAGAGVSLIETGLPLDWFDCTPQQVLDSGAAITRLAHDQGVDLIHLNSPALAASAPSAIPVVAVAHGCLATWWAASRPGQPLPHQWQWHRQFCGEGLRAAARVVAPTRSFARQIARTYGLRETPIAVHNGRRLPACADTAPHDIAFTAGRLWDGAKRTGLLDDAAGRLAFPFHAAGPTASPQGECVAPANLHLLGQLDETGMAQWLARRPVFVSAASFEPFGLAVLEAAAAGCALILSDIPTFRELWGGAAVFLAEDGPGAWAWAIDAIVADPPFRRALADAARSRAGRYTSEAMAAAMARIYGDVLHAALQGRAA
jgi:glycosyltransferase involved in cell wall biosynthesis